MAVAETFEWTVACRWCGMFTPADSVCASCGSPLDVLSTCRYCGEPSLDPVCRRCAGALARMWHLARAEPEARYLFADLP